MQRRMTTWALGGLLALAGSASAQDAHHRTRSRRKTSRPGRHHRREGVRGPPGDAHLRRATRASSTCPSAYTLPKGKASFSLFRDNLDRDPKDIDISIHGLSLGYGATDKLEIFGSIGLQNRVNVDALCQAGLRERLPVRRDADPPGWQTGFGDVKLGAKYKFLDDYHGDARGPRRCKAYVKLRTADEAKGLGTGKASFGADLILSKSLNRDADIHASIGYQINSDPDEPRHRQRLQVGRRRQRARLPDLPAPGRADGHESTAAPTSTRRTRSTWWSGRSFWIKPGIFIRPAFS